MNIHTFISEETVGRVESHKSSTVDVSDVVINSNSSSPVQAVPDKQNDRSRMISGGSSVSVKSFKSDEKSLKSDQQTGNSQPLKKGTCNYLLFSAEHLASPKPSTNKN